MISIPSSDDAVQAGRAELAMNLEQARRSEAARPATEQYNGEGSHDLGIQAADVSVAWSESDEVEPLRVPTDSALLLPGTHPANVTRYGWDGQAVDGKHCLTVPEDSFPKNVRSGLNVASLAKGAGLAEIIQVTSAGGTIRLRKGYYKWQVGGMPASPPESPEADDFFESRELLGDALLVPYPISFVGETASEEAPLAATTYDAACTPNISVRLHGQWLLTALPKNWTGSGALWTPGPDTCPSKGSFDNLFFVHRTYLTPSIMVDVRGGSWAFHGCQLRAADGGVPLGLYGACKVSAWRTGVGGIAKWRYEASAGALLYGSARLHLRDCTVEWVRFDGQGVRVWDCASLRAHKSTFQFNGVDVGFDTAHARVGFFNCSFRGSETGALWAMGQRQEGSLSEEGSLSVVSCRFYGPAWRRGATKHTCVPSKFEWENITELEGVARPRTWRPFRKREASCWDSSGEPWSDTDTVSDDDAHGLLNDPFPIVDLDEIVFAQPEDQAYEHAARTVAAPAPKEF
jgi:hypothetical protein